MRQLPNHTDTPSTPVVRLPYLQTQKPPYQFSSIITHILLVILILPLFTSCAPSGTPVHINIPNTASHINSGAFDLLTPPPAPDNYFAICTSVKNEHGDLREWVQYHRCIGVSRIYVYDDNSTPPMLPEVADLVDEGVVVYKHVSFPQAVQVLMFNECLTSYRTHHTWMAMLDIDEFIVLNKGAQTDDMRVFLRNFEKYAAVAMQWRIFSSSGFRTRPITGVLRNYYKCVEDEDSVVDGWTIKSIVNTQYAQHYANPHYVTPFDYDAVYEVNADTYHEQWGFLMCDYQKHNDTCPPTRHVDKIQVNHYATKSWDDFLKKTKRGGGDPPGFKRTWAFYYTVAREAKEVCLEGVRQGRRCFGDVNLLGLLHGKHGVVDGSNSVSWSQVLSMERRKRGGQAGGLAQVQVQGTRRLAGGGEG